MRCVHTISDRLQGQQDGPDWGPEPEPGLNLESRKNPGSNPDRLGGSCIGRVEKPDAMRCDVMWWSSGGKPRIREMDSRTADCGPKDGKGWRRP